MALTLKDDRFGDPLETRWFDFDEDTEALIARWDNPKYTIGLARYRTLYDEKRQRLLQEATDPNGHIRFDDKVAEVDDDEQSEIDAQSRLMARYIVLDVRTKSSENGCLEIDGREVEYDANIGYQLLSKNVDFFVWAAAKSRQLQNEAFQLAENTKKKPSTRSSGKSGGKMVKRAPKPSTRQ